MRNFKTQAFLIAGLCFLGMSGIASADATGSASLADCGGGGDIISATTLNWSPVGTQPNTGCFRTGISTSISYSGGLVAAGAFGNIKDLTAGGSVDQFMTILGTLPLLDFVLTAILPPATASTACDTVVGDSCIVAPGSPFLLTNTATGVSIVLDPVGTITDGGVTNPWSAIFTTQLSGTTDVAVQAIINGGGSISSSYSAALTIGSSTTAVPEPNTLSLCLAGGLALFGIGRRRVALKS
jgi:hypothetical protein